MRRPGRAPGGLAPSLLCALLGLASTACDDEPLTEILVVVESDLAVPSALDTVVVHASGPSGDDRVALGHLDDPAGEGLPVTVALVPAGSVLGPLEITAEAWHDELRVLSRRARTRFVEGEVRVLRLALEARCGGVECSGDTTCVSGACEPIEIPSEALERWTGVVPGGDAGRGDGGPDAGPPPARAAKIVVGGNVPAGASYAFVLDPEEGAVADNLSVRLQAAVGPPTGPSAAAEVDPRLSPDGRWLVVRTDRFEPCRYGCIVLFPMERLAEAEVLRAGTEPVYGYHPAVTDAADAVVLRASDERLAITRRRPDGDGWTELEPLGNPAFGDAHHIVLSADSSRALYNCQAPGALSAICEAALDGSDSRVVIDETMAPFGNMSDDPYVRHGDYAPDGSIVFEANWMGNQIWRVSAAGGPAERVSDGFATDLQASCVLPDGRIVAIDYAGEWDFVVLSPAGDELFHLPFPDPVDPTMDWSVDLAGC